MEIIKRIYYLLSMILMFKITLIVLPFICIYWIFKGDSRPFDYLNSIFDKLILYLTDEQPKD